MLSTIKSRCYWNYHSQRSHPFPVKKPTKFSHKHLVFQRFAPKSLHSKVQMPKIFEIWSFTFWRVLKRGTTTSCFLNESFDILNDELIFFLLLVRSRFVIAVQDYKAPGEGTSFLSFLKGDLVLLEEDSTGETVLNNGWCIGKSFIILTQQKSLLLIYLILYNNNNKKVAVNELKNAVTSQPKQFMCCRH